jgi:heat shock protein HtpX
MASFFDEIARNGMKSALLFFVFFVFFAFVIMIFAFFLGTSVLGGLIIGAVIVAIYAIIAYFMGGKMVLKISKAQKADPGQYHYLYDIVEGLSSATQVKMPEVYIINDPNPNAFATGRNRNHAYIAVTTGLLSMMDKRELQGVIAHELSHVADNDILYMLVAVAFAGAIGMVAAIIRNSVFFMGVPMGGNRRNGNGTIIVIIALIIGLLAPLFALLLRLAISRRREYMADANGSRLTRDPHSLASALSKIRDYTKNPQARPVMHANDITASLYFSNPLRANGVTNLFSTHPPIDERINRLEHMY